MFLKSYFLLVFIALLLNDQVKGIVVEDCGSQDGVWKNVTVTGCEDTKPICSFHRNTNVTLQTTFVSKVESSTAKLKIVGYLGVIPVPFKVDSDACKVWNVHCPILPGQLNTLQVTLPILSQYPPITVEVEIKLEDSLMKYLLCTKFKAQIV